MFSGVLRRLKNPGQKFSDVLHLCKTVFVHLGPIKVLVEHAPMVSPRWTVRYEPEVVAEAHSIHGPFLRYRHQDNILGHSQLIQNETRSIRVDVRSLFQQIRSYFEGVKNDGRLHRQVEINEARS